MKTYRFQAEVNVYAENQRQAIALMQQFIASHDGTDDCERVVVGLSLVQAILPRPATGRQADAPTSG